MSGNFVVYLIGYLIAIAGIAYGMSAAGLGQQWIIAVVLVMAGLGIVYALSRSQRDTESQKASETPSQQVVTQQSPPQEESSSSAGSQGTGTGN